MTAAQHTQTHSQDSRTADRLWADYARAQDPRTRERLRGELVHQFERLAYSIANRFARQGRGIAGGDNDDLFQVAMLGLVKAVDRFDPSTNYRFSTFATPTILGEIRRYYRDHTWNVHVPRSMQELVQHVQRGSRGLAEKLGRIPTAAEVAAHLEVPEAEVEQALWLQENNRPLSLDGEMECEGERPVQLVESLGGEDGRMREAEHRVTVQQALGNLSEPLAQILRLRYLSDLSQREVARRLGVSQMRVSRLERKALDQLRTQFAIN